MPVLILTACDDLKECIRGLDAGADDYLTKPFEFGELAVRQTMSAIAARSTDRRHAALR